MGSLYKQKDSKNWWMKYAVDGAPKRNSTRTPDHEHALRILKLREGEVAKGRQSFPNDQVRLEDLGNDLIADMTLKGRRSVDRAKGSLKHLYRILGKRRRAVSIRATSIRDYALKRKSEQAANGTINRELAALKRMFYLGIELEKLAECPHIALLEEDNVRTGFFEFEEFQALRAALPGYAQGPVTFAYTYGWRKREILAIEWDRVDLETGAVRLGKRYTKEKEGRFLVLTTELREIFRALWVEAQVIVRASNPDAADKEVRRQIPWVFHRHGKQMKGFRRAWLTATKKAKLEGRYLHDFRRTAARDMIRDGTSEGVAMKVTGHRTASMFKRYNIVDDADYRAVANRINHRRESLVNEHSSDCSTPVLGDQQGRGSE